MLLRLVALLLALSPLVVPGPAAAQADGIVLAQNREGPGIFRFLFGERRDPPRYVIVPGPPPPAAQPRATPRRTVRPKSAQPKQAAAPPAPRVEEVEKAENAKRVLVVGDFFARSAAKGLAAAYAENPNVLVIDATNGSSGLVRDDFYDWPESLPPLVEEHKPDAILVMVGANDRQNIAGSGAKSVGDEAWRAAYSARVQSFADVLGKTGLPVFWGSLVPVERSALSSDYSAFNTIFQEAIAGKPIRYVDFWDGFADAEGRFTSVGPDVQGQSVRLRDTDGLNFTRAGQAKLAFFFQRDLDALIGGTLPAVALPGAVAGPAAPAIGPMVPIGALTVATGDTLATAGEEPEESVVDAVVKRLDAEPPRARADNFSWSGVR